MTPGSHGSTYGSNPLAMAVGNAVLDVMLQDGFSAHVQAMGALLKNGLELLQAKHPHVIEEVRGTGLLLGIKTRGSHHALVDRLRVAKLLTSPAQENVIRIIPPLVVSGEEIREALAILAKVCEETL
mgnify:CR=1 FL=1